MIIIDVNVNQLRSLMTTNTTLFSVTNGDIVKLVLTTKTAYFRTLIQLPEDPTERRLMMQTLPKSMHVQAIFDETEFYNALIKEVGDIRLQLMRMEANGVNTDLE